MFLSLITVATNPITSNYLTFFACVNSWASIVDEIIVVDGGTTDGSYKSDLISNNAKNILKIVYNENTQWDYDKGFSSNQINRMFIEGVKVAKGDWAFVIGADYILRPIAKNILQSELKKYSHKSWLRYKRETIFPYIGEIRYDHSTNHILNLKWVDLNLGHRNIYGVKMDSQIIYDYPIYPELGFNEKLSKNSKIYQTLLGELLFDGGDIVIESVTIVNVGHFFYNIEQEIEQRMVFQEYFISRARGDAPIKMSQSKFSLGKIFGEIDKSKILNCDYPVEMLEIIDMFYVKGMVGGLKKEYSYLKSRHYRYRMKLYGLARYLKTNSLKFRGFRGTNYFADKRLIKEVPNSTPIVLNDIWGKQDVLLGVSK